MEDCEVMAEFGSYIGDWKGRLIIGIIAVIVGFMFLLVPGFTLTLLIYLFAFLLIASGVVLLFFSRSETVDKRWRTLNIIEGILAIAIGIIALVWPGITALFVIYLIGFFALFSGILQIAEGLVASSKAEGAPNRWLLIISGTWSLILGCLFLIAPGAGALALIWLIGFFLIVAGVLNIAAGMKLRSGPAKTA
jgi:uncharacterized membrane protein HdeD (DUF308 family)